MSRQAKSERARVLIQKGLIHEAASHSERALVRAGAPLYSRAGQLVRPVVDELPAADGGITKIARLRPVTVDALLDHLSRVADFGRFLESGKLKRIDPPLAIAKTILARDGEWLFEPLAGVLTTPTIRPDGSLLIEPGFDPQTRILLRDPPAMPTLDESPTRDQAERALANIEALLIGFPFCDEASRSVAISAILTPIARGGMACAPLHALTAPAPGTGKSYLTDITSGILTGQRAPVIAAGHNGEELEKRLGAALLGGQSLISLDNVNGKLSGDCLAQLIERPVVEIRPLGRSNLVRVESRATVFGNGNNLQLTGDMTRRSLLCSMDSGVERPELRQFSFDPFRAVLADRGKYIAAALTVVRAYIVAGSPDPCPRLASFEQWSDRVRSAIVWLGRADPVETIETARADDPEQAARTAIFLALHEAFGNASWIVSDAMKLISDSTTPNHNADLERAFIEISGTRGPTGKLIGHWLARNKGRVVEGLRLLDEPDLHRKQKKWRIVARG